MNNVLSPHRDPCICTRYMYNIFSALNKPSFTTLDIGNNGREVLSALSPLLHTFEALNISGRFDAFSGVGFAALTGFPGLHLNHLKGAQQFKELNLAVGNTDGRGRLQTLIEVLRGMLHLRKLDITDITVRSTKQWKALCSVIRCMKNLEELWLPKFDVTKDVAWEALAQTLMNKDKLKVLNLDENDLTYSGARVLATCVPTLPALKHLSVAGRLTERLCILLPVLFVGQSNQPTRIIMPVVKEGRLEENKLREDAFGTLWFNGFPYSYLALRQADAAGRS